MSKRASSRKIDSITYGRIKFELEWMLSRVRSAKKPLRVQKLLDGICSLFASDLFIIIHLDRGYLFYDLEWNPLVHASELKEMINDLNSMEIEF